jgi:hypothetical protein
MKSNLLIAVLLAACTAQSQTLRVVPVHLDATVPIPQTIQFFCTQDYDRQACLKDSLALRLSLSPYPLERLATWSFVLVPADNWKVLVHSLGGDPVSPAFSIIEQRMTVFDRSLFSANASRSEELLQLFGVMGTALLDLAVTHELGHAICQDKDERRADDDGRGLRERKTVCCAKNPQRMSVKGTSR